MDFFYNRKFKINFSKEVHSDHTILLKDIPIILFVDIYGDSIDDYHKKNINNYLDIYFAVNGVTVQFIQCNLIDLNIYDIMMKKSIIEFMSKNKYGDSYCLNITNANLHVNTNNIYDDHSNTNLKY